MSDLKDTLLFMVIQMNMEQKINSIKLLLFYEYFYHSLCNLSKQDIIDIKKKFNMTD